MIRVIRVGKLECHIFALNQILVLLLLNNHTTVMHKDILAITLTTHNRNKAVSSLVVEPFNSTLVTGVIVASCCFTHYDMERGHLSNPFMETMQIG